MNKRNVVIKRLVACITFCIICFGLVIFGGTVFGRKNNFNKEVSLLTNYVYADEGERVLPDSPTEKKEKPEDGVNVQNIFIICIVGFLAINAGIVVTINVIKDRRHKAIFERLEKERLEIDSDENTSTRNNSTQNASVNGNGVNQQ